MIHKAEFVKHGHYDLRDATTLAKCVAVVESDL